MVYVYAFEFLACCTGGGGGIGGTKALYTVKTGVLFLPVGSVLHTCQIIQVCQYSTVKCCTHKNNTLLCAV